ncbi:MAG: hypothetical protein QNK33_05125 [Bacteroidales bacterium]|nr:hypothetical protein [Bacteroidales bacterium]
MSKKLLPLLIIFCSLGSARAQSKAESSVLNYYIGQNNKETRLYDFKDSDNMLMLKLKQLEQINLSRKKHGAKALKLDILASRVANKMCREAAENGYVGHWNLAGEKPYHRYAFAGGNDHITENASGESSSAVFLRNNTAIGIMMHNNHLAFMNEKRPHDGHKQTVIDRNHNYVGLGFYITDHNTAYYELYIDRYYQFEDVPASVKIGETINLKCRPAEKQYFSLLLAYFEKEPSPLSPRTISSRSSYDDFSKDIAIQIPPWEINNYKEGEWYNFTLKFGKVGLYYIQIFSDSRPYKEGSRYSSDGKLQASGIVIRVNK